MDLNSVNNTGIDTAKYLQGTQTTTETETTVSAAEPNSFSEAAAVYETSGGKHDVLTDAGYKVDMDKIIAMKTEQDERMIDLFKKAVKGGFIKQIRGGLKHFAESLRGYTSEGYEKANGLANIDIKGITVSDTEKVTLAGNEDNEDGPGANDPYWSPEETSERMLNFAIALSGDDRAKADMLLDAVKKGYEEAERLWGEELPQISKDTLKMTIERFEAWRDGVDYIPGGLPQEEQE